MRGCGCQDDSVRRVIIVEVRLRSSRQFLVFVVEFCHRVVTQYTVSIFIFFVSTLMIGFIVKLKNQNKINVFVLISRYCKFSPYFLF